jgi:hypothetical protein
MREGASAPSSARRTANGQALSRQELLAFVHELVTPPPRARAAPGFTQPDAASAA